MRPLPTTDGPTPPRIGRCFADRPDATRISCLFQWPRRIPRPWRWRVSRRLQTLHVASTECSPGRPALPLAHYSPHGELLDLNPVRSGLLTQAHPEHTQADTHAHPAYSLLVSDGVEAAILATLPSGPGQRNHRLFDLARRLKAIMPGATMDALEVIVRAWHSRIADHHHEGLAGILDRLSNGIGARQAGGGRDDGRDHHHGQGADAGGCRRHRQADGAVPSPARASRARPSLAAIVPHGCQLHGRGHYTSAGASSNCCSEGVIELATEAGSKGSRRAAEYRFLGE